MNLTYEDATPQLLPDWERYSNRQETKMKMGGFIGSITFEGDFKEFIPFLLLGEYVHVGKGTSFGLGKYEIILSTMKNHLLQVPGIGTVDLER